MANEAKVQLGLNIRIGELNYQSYPKSFQADVNMAIGPTPGAILVTTSGTVIDLSVLATPGFCWLTNLDPTNFVTYGLFDSATFFPFGELLPGEINVVRLSRFLGEAQLPGTSTTNVEAIDFMAKANVASCYLRVDAFNA